MGWIVDLLIGALAVCAVGLMIYKKMRQARRGKRGRKADFRLQIADFRSGVKWKFHFWF